MRFFMSFAVLLAFTGSSQGRLIPRDKIVLNKKEAFDFFGFFKDIDHECYEEGCTFGEVVDHYGHKEKSYEYWNTYQCEKFQKGCTGIVSGNCITFPDANIRGSKTPCITITHDKECRGNSVGIEDPDKVSGGGIVASSWLRSNLDFAPSQGRLHNEKGSWCANKQEEDPKPYLQVELPVRTGVCAVATQGSALYDTDYVTKYEIQTSLDKENWVTYQENGTDKIFHGNTNADHMLKVNLDQPVLAMFVRFVIKEFVEWPCMRVEVYGTPANCTVRTKDNECCVFPFMYKGERHFSCLPSLFNGDWCATTHDYGKDKKWGECLEGDLNA